MRRLLPLALALALRGGLAEAAEAERSDAADGPNWYRVEVLVFADRDVGAGTEETWPLLPVLEYPRTFVRVEHGPVRTRADAPRRLVPLEEQLPPGSSFDLAAETPVEQLLADFEYRRRWKKPDIELEPLFELDVPLAFRLLDESDMEFAGRRRRLDRDLRVLLHRSWLQPVLERERSTPVLIDGGDIRDGFPELQGSLLLYSARYLHLETRLWLNTNGDYLDYPWRMPPPPPPPEKEELPPIAPFAVNPPADWLVPEPIATGEMPAMQAGEKRAEENGDESETPWTEAQVRAFLDEPAYPFRHAVALRQQRRMRGGELHYLDHPMIGLIIKVSRYEFAPFARPVTPRPP